jgi:hypothetical protein
MKSSSRGGGSFELDGGAAYDEGEITHLSVKTIEVYQIQGQLVDRLWAYFNQYSAMLILIGLAAVAFKDSPVIANIPTLFAIVLAVAYGAFSAGNHRALSLSMDELFVLRNIAMLQTRLRFRGADKSDILRFHLLMIVVSAAIFIGCWFYAKA